MIFTLLFFASEHKIMTLNIENTEDIKKKAAPLSKRIPRMKAKNATAGNHSDKASFAESYITSISVKSLVKFG